MFNLQLCSSFLENKITFLIASREIYCIDYNFPSKFLWFLVGHVLAPPQLELFKQEHNRAK